MGQLLAVAGIADGLDDAQVDDDEDDESFDSIDDMLDEIGNIVEAYGVFDAAAKAKALDTATPITAGRGMLQKTATKVADGLAVRPADEQAFAPQDIGEQKTAAAKDSKKAAFEPGPVKFKDDAALKKESLAGPSVGELLEDIDRRISLK